MKQFGVILPAAAALSFGLAACSGDPAPSDEGDNTASGEVLEGSISDAMLPLDTIQSQSPPLESVQSDEPETDGAENDSEE